MIADGTVTTALLWICNAFSLSFDVKGVSSKFAFYLVSSLSLSQSKYIYTGNKTLKAIHVYEFCNSGGAALP